MVQKLSVFKVSVIDITLRKTLVIADLYVTW
jgi:hypothetical protein